MRTHLRMPPAAAALLAMAVALGAVVSVTGSAHAAEPRGAAASAAAPTPGPNPLARGAALPTYSAAAVAAADARAKGRAAVADAIDVIARTPTATWLGEWYSDAELVRVLKAETAAAKKQKKVATFVMYAIPARDCAAHSQGGLTPTRYRAWTKLIADTLRGTGSAVIVEPDALAMLGDCTGQGPRTTLIRDAVSALTASGVAAYIDAGNANWVPPETMAQRLRDAGVLNGRGFATNVSNFSRTATEQQYAERLRTLLGGTPRYVIDTSRNGRGWQGDWCNPSGVGLGTTPRAGASGSALDALLWIKRPGESDGVCNGGPAAGSWYEKAALELVRNRVR
ncbi:glycoside hydrolase family 6 protein [Microbacterium sp. cf332]|uniref:glycoside hydrolase family 6 protein n=1 Tax=Microbacterium sp. cf332 TaxID=1761804 RepID=UPI0008901E71|nr:glycoside hydrolase family 6 protein [Microbacterium sp. cf332]SDQ56801.1 endoglucanase [Microbacterium sp. cf332]